MGEEIERKFLLERLPPGLGDGERIEQGYLAIADDGVEVRVRRRAGQATLTIKSGPGHVRTEEELEIDARRFSALWPLTEGRRLTKTRHLVKLGDGVTAEVDVYHDAHDGLLVAEIEFDSVEASDGFPAPEWLGREVTGDRRYANQSLAVEGRPPRSAVYGGSVRRLAIWPALAGVVLAGGLALDAIGLPSSYLFAALIIGLAIALLRPDSVAVPPLAFRASQAVAGVSLGAYVQSDALRAVAGSAVPVLLVSAATLLFSLAAGAILARTTPLDPATAALGLIAGGASGIVGMSGELGADDRLVAFMQYLRVLVVVVLTPLGIAVFFGGQHGDAAAAIPGAGTAGEPWQWLLAAALAVAGAALAQRLRVTAGILLGPMVLTAAVVLLGLADGFAVPALLGQTAFALIGLQVGLRFTIATVRLLGRLTGPVLLAIAGLLVACFGLAVLLDATTSATLLDSYLATTPGGLYAVLAVAYGAGANTTFIVAVQSLRVIAMVLLAPLAVRWTLNRTRGRAAECAS